MEKKVIIMIFFVALFLLVLGFFVGKEFEENRIANELIENIEYCAENDRVLRVFFPDDIIRFECFGKKPTLELFWG